MYLKMCAQFWIASSEISAGNLQHFHNKETRVMKEVILLLCRKGLPMFNPEKQSLVEEA